MATDEATAKDEGGAQGDAEAGGGKYAAYPGAKAQQGAGVGPSPPRFIMNGRRTARGLYAAYGAGMSTPSKPFVRLEPLLQEQAPGNACAWSSAVRYSRTERLSSGQEATALESRAAKLGLTKKRLIRPMSTPESKAA
jgi:hypothetical protein